MRRTGSRTRRPRRIVGIHERGASISVVVLEEGRGLVDAFEAAAMDEVASRLGARVADGLEIVTVIPGAQTVCRVERLPRGEGDEALDAMELLAEAQFGDRIPRHRIAFGRIPDEAPDDSDAPMRVLLTAWTASDAPSPLGLPTRFVSEVAALARLRGASRGIAWSLNPARGSIAVLAEQNGHLACRALRVPSEHEDWRSASRAILDETLRAVGASMDPAMDRTLCVERASVDAISRQVAGIPADDAWLERFAVALGAALIALDDDPLVRSFARLRAEAEAPPASPWTRLLRTLDARGRALTIAAAALLLAVWGPLAFAALRVGVLEHESGGLEAARAERFRLESLAAIYAQLDRERLPVTKLLADIASSAPMDPPDSVQISLVRITPEREVLVEGACGSPDLVATFQRNLNATGIFQRVTVTRASASQGAVEFSLLASIAPNPYRMVARTPETDYIARSSAARLYGDEAAARIRPGTTARVPERSPTASRTPPARPLARGDDDAQTSTRERPARVEIPDPLSEAEISAMSRSEAMMAFVKRRNLVQSNPDLDEQTRSRLDDEAERLRAHLDSLRGGGG